jgi:hypothetical protein
MSARLLISLIAAIALSLLAGLQWVLLALMTERSTWSMLVPPLATLAAVISWVTFLLTRRTARTSSSS